MDFIANNLSAFFTLMKTFTISDFFDISIMSFIIYNFIKLIRETRASQLVKGILILIIAYLASFQFNFRMLGYLLNKFFEFGIIALLVVFQPELRRALEQIGRSKISRYWISSSANGYDLTSYKLQQNCIKTVVDAIFLLQQTKTGALIVFERQTKLGDIINTGTVLRAKPSIAIIGNIFFNKAPLHDGAMIIRGPSIYAAGCILPLTKNDNVSLEIGTRHRAALGISEISDAIAIVVSEENGKISTAINGNLIRNYSKEKLIKLLEKNILLDSKKIKVKNQFIESIIMRKKNGDKKI